MTRRTVTVVICAYTMHRWEDLIAAVDSAAAQPETSQVIIVVDHNAELLDRARRRWIDRPVLANTYRKGLSGARNTGLDAAEGEIVAFLDDDAVACPGWLASLCAQLERAEVVGVGGTAEPSWPGGRPPATLPPELLWVVGCSYRGLPTTCAEVRNIMGCSMAFRRSSLAGIGGFSLDSGRVGSVPLGGEETDVCIRLRQDDPGCQIVFVPTSRVLHRVSPDRLTWRYLRRRSFYEGVSKAVLGRRLGAGDALATERSYVRAVLPHAVARELAALRWPRAVAIVYSVMSAGAGYLFGMARSSRTASHAVGTPDAVQR